MRLIRYIIGGVGARPICYPQVLASWAPARKVCVMLGHDEQRLLDDIGRHLGDEDPVFAARMCLRSRPRRVPPLGPDRSKPLLAVTAVMTVAAWLAVGIGWLAALAFATISMAVVAAQTVTWRRRRWHRHVR